MASDRSRVSYDPSRQYRGLVAQQGRVTVEADWNEATAIDDANDRAVTLDVVGPVGTPDGGYAVTAVPATGGPAGSTPGDLDIAPGTLYLGGERLELDTPGVTYSAQPDWLDHLTDPSGEWVPPTAPEGTETELVYLLAYEQEVSAVEDPALADVALGGPDTMQRQRIQQHFVRQTTTAASCDQAWGNLQSFPGLAGVSFDSTTMRLESTSQLHVTMPGTGGTVGPCDPVAVGGYLGAENQMIRVMVTGVNADGSAQIVWGFDDASFLFRAQGAPTFDGTNTIVNLQTAPVDSYHNPVQGQVVELLRDATALLTNGQNPPATDYIASATGWVSSLAVAYQSMQLSISGQAPSQYTDGTSTPQVYVRIWQATMEAPAGTAVALGNLGVSVTLSTTNGSFHVGDYWRFALRPLETTIVYPARYALAPQPPDGPRTWGCPLAMLSWSNGTATVSSCVPPFDDLVQLTRSRGGCCTVDVGPGDVDNGAGLQKLIDSLAGSGPVTVCLEPGVYTLTAPLIIDGDNDGLTLQACRGGVVFQAPAEAGFEFVTGLVSVRGAIGVVFTGIAFVLPLVSFSPAANSFSALRPQNQTLMDLYASNLLVSIGISAENCIGLGVVECTFSFQSAGGANLYGAGIFATGYMEAVNIAGSNFDQGGIIPPATAPFYDLSAGIQVTPPYQLTVGYLQIPTFPVERGATLEITQAEVLTTAAATSGPAPAAKAAAAAQPAHAATAPSESERVAAAVNATRTVVERALASKTAHVAGRAVLGVAAGALGGPLAGAVGGLAVPAAANLAKDVVEKAGAGVAKQVSDAALSGGARKAVDEVLGGAAHAADKQQAAETSTVQQAAAGIEHEVAGQVATSEAAAGKVAADAEKKVSTGDVKGAVSEVEKAIGEVLHRPAAAPAAMAAKPPAEVTAHEPAAAAAPAEQAAAADQAAATEAAAQASPATDAATTPAAAANLVTATQRLNDAAIENCFFQGVTVPVIVLAQIGAIRVEQNTVRATYGGFWLISLILPFDVTYLDYLAVGDPQLFEELAVLGISAMADRVFVMVTALGRVLPSAPPVQGQAVNAGRIATGAASQQQHALESFLKLYSAVSGSTSGPGGSSGPAGGGAPAGGGGGGGAAGAAAPAAPTAAAHSAGTTGAAGTTAAPAAEAHHGFLSEVLHHHTQEEAAAAEAAASAPAAPEAAKATATAKVTETATQQADVTEVARLSQMLPVHLAAAFSGLSASATAARAPVVPVAEPGTGVYLRLDFSGNEVEAVLRDSYSGAGLNVIDFVGDNGSCLVNDNRIRDRFPEGQTVLIGNVLQCAANGNVMANEVPEPAAPAGKALIRKPGPLPTPSPTPTPTPVQQAPSYSMVLWPAPGAFTIPEVVVMGNLFIDLVILPLRPLAPAPLNTWFWLNTVIDYQAPAGG